MKRAMGWAVVLGLPMLVGACNLLTPLIFIGEHKKMIAPEFDKLTDARCAVLVWTDQSTLFSYPFARFELATYIRDKLYTETAQRSMGTEFVDPRDVEDFLQKRIHAQIEPHTVGREFDVDYVIFVEVSRFQIRDAEQPQLLRGQINAAVTVYDIRADIELTRTFELAPVDCQYPDNGPVLMTATNSPEIREASYFKFAEMVARKFYEYAVDL